MKFYKHSKKLTLSGMLPILILLAGCKPIVSTTISSTQNIPSTIETTSNALSFTETKQCKIQDIFENNAQNLLQFPNKIRVGVEDLKNSDDSFQERVMILNTDTCKKILIESPAILEYRTVDSLKKIDDFKFSFIITAQPHFGHYFEYDLNGNELKMETLADECFALDSLPKNLQEKAMVKCQEHPELKTYDDLLQELEKN